MTEIQADVVIVGGGLGGTAAALTAVRRGCSVVLTEQTRWIGGQLTAQAVPPDENEWIEDFGATASYRRLRRRIRDHYRRNYPLTLDAATDPFLNPGNGRVSRLCHEPRAAHAVLSDLLASPIASGRLRLLLEHEPVQVAVGGDRLEAVAVRNNQTGAEITLTGSVFIDATELGDLLELGGVEHVIGSESAADTGEPHALDGPAQPLDQQAFSVCFALEHRPGEDHTIDRPAEYDFWNAYKADFWPDKQLSWWEVFPDSLSPHHRPIFQDPPHYPGRDGCDLWHFRRILDHANFTPDSGIRDVTLVNWPAIDYWLGPLTGVSADERRTHEERARQLSLSYLYWMQTEAPRLDGGVGYRGLRLRSDLTGDGPDGLALYPYVREARRIRAETTVTEQHISVTARGDLRGAEDFHDSVGIGHYRLDLHPSTGGPGGPRTYIDLATWPFQIPLGALLPVRVDNLLPAAKNIGTTHVTNGCYRLHPVEWNIGEVSGALAEHCVHTGDIPRAVRADERKLTDFQRVLSSVGVPLRWPDDVRTRGATPIH
ncbi:FAD-dependent oxidoreductase [Kribbella capetownensis]|uniref:FAD-dependent oxidoreductase n=1 Tax=Kribbella capetownensis TaxID=1572659 RepID=A0A4R0JM79_9ACTN|nr:FAD-dependent oxidoreductase [Kribbella capetownensis]TCC47779.1 FAD-dependent oxidoreductase [Kribbella capetownensis]